MNNFKLTKTPFPLISDQPEVFVTAGNGPYENTINALKNLDLSAAQGKKVLLKPNTGRISPPKSGITTEPQVIAAAIDCFRDVGAEVAIGESPITGVKTMEAYEANGTAQMAKAKNCPLIDMDVRRFVPVRIPNGIAIDSLKVCPEVTEFDIVVSIPVMKMHMHTGVTLSIKNMKGCLWRRSKVDLHMLPPIDEYEEKPIDIAIADLTEILTPHLAIIDGTIGMEGLGPSAGKPKPLDVVVVGTDPFAADAVACRIMGTAAEKIPHLYLAAQRGYGIIDLKKIRVSPGNWQDLSSKFDAPPKNLTFQFPNIKVFDRNSCSACQSSLLLFLKRYGEGLFEYFPDQKEINIAIGKGNENLPDNTICIGNCTRQHKGKGIFVPGCPPVSSKILSAISHKPSVDVMDGHSTTPGKKADK